MNQNSILKTNTLSKRKVLSICLLAIVWTAQTSLLLSLQEITTGVCILASSSLNGLYNTNKKDIHILEEKMKMPRKSEIHQPASNNDLHIDAFLFVLPPIETPLPGSQISPSLITRARRLRWGNRHNSSSSSSSSLCSFHPFHGNSTLQISLLPQINGSALLFLLHWTASETISTQSTEAHIFSNLKIQNINRKIRI